MATLADAVYVYALGDAVPAAQAVCEQLIDRFHLEPFAARDSAEPEAQQAAAAASDATDPSTDPDDGGDASEPPKQ
jgi:hypothetical protein